MGVNDANDLEVGVTPVKRSDEIGMVKVHFSDAEKGTAEDENDYEKIAGSKVAVSIAH